MTSPLDQLARFGAVPSGEDRDEVFSWAFGQETYRDGGIERAHVDQVLVAMSWHRITHTRNTWEDDPLVLSRMVSSLAAGLWHLGGAVGLRATGGRQGLDLRLGTLTAQSAAPLATVAANLPGTVVDVGSGSPPPAWRASGGLRAIPDPDAEGSAPALLDRLTALVGTEWHLDALLVPVPTPEINRHAIALARLATHLAGERSHQVQVDPLRTMAVEDPVVGRLIDAVDGEQGRVDLARRCGAFAVVASLSSPDGAQLASAVGAATGAAPSASIGWSFVIPNGGQEVLPSTVVASGELVDLMRVPLHDVHGLPRRQWQRLDAHPEPVGGRGATTIRLGQTEQGAPIELPVQLLTHHMLVTGASGSGKSTFVAQTLVRLATLGVPLWIIEPVKNEWHSLGVPGLRRWAIGAPDPGLPWGLNPLEVPDGVPVATHVDLLVSLFRTAFGLPDPLPHLVELGLHATYEAMGWDLGSDRSLRAEDRSSIEWPTIGDLLDVCMRLPAELRYEEAIQGNLRAALLARMGGLARGPRGRLLDTTDRFPINEALDDTLVINLDGIGDDHARSFVMGLLLIRLSEHRRVHPSSSLAHVTVIEEAHRLMGATTGPATGGADPVGGTSTMFGNLQGEIRATGEGLIVIDQSPRALIRATLVNTGTQVALRSKDRDDQEALGAAIGLAPGQDRVLSSLAVHEGLVAWEGMDVPVRARLDAIQLRSVAPPAGSTVRARLPDTAGPVDQAAEAFLRVGAADHARARGALLDAIEAANPGMDSQTKADVLADVVGRHVRAAARRRGWSRTQREAATRAALGGRFEGSHPSQLLLDGRTPYLSCRAVCPHGGCLVGELVEPEARAILAEGAGTVVRLVASASEARHRLRRRAMAAVSATAPTALQQLAFGCVAVQVFDSWADPDLVRRLVAEIRDPDGGAAHG